MKIHLIILVLISHFALAEDNLVEKTQTFRALAFGSRDETCDIVSEDLVGQMEAAEETILKLDGIIVGKIIDPCLYSEGMQTSMFGEITYLIHQEGEALE